MPSRGYSVGVMFEDHLVRQMERYAEIMAAK